MGYGPRKLPNDVILEKVFECQGYKKNDFSFWLLILPNCHKSIISRCVHIIIIHD